MGHKATNKDTSSNPSEKTQMRGGGSGERGNGSERGAGARGEDVQREGMRQQVCLVMHEAPG